MCLITKPRDNEVYTKETYIAPRPTSTHSRRSHSEVYAYRDGTFSREYTTPAVVRTEYPRSNYTPSTRSNRSHRSTSSRRSNQTYITRVPASPARVSTKYSTEMVPVARTETVYVTEEEEPTRIKVQPLQLDYSTPRRERVENVYTTGRVSPAVVVESRRNRVYY